ncbi:MAG: UDP-3-O-(3-hydroxymyristoyl)glucosamine N-acyltransferase [Betaproteobacteria bacterium RIFCSPLOWO2_12_FULL_65_14]|nr:MAG: UDP-3-O-(3-hydroxymyristoyl)glucosamine N-acyltransferase [Betaproteobacteria bacterium RIFCSPLOWO2_12_FULL_65_14]
MPGPLTLGQIAARLGGRVVGDPNTTVRQVGSLEQAGAGEITFLSNAKHKAKLAETRASAVVLAPESEGLTALPRIVSDAPYLYFARLSQLFNPLTVQPEGVHPSAVVSPTARLGARVSIGAGCVIGDEVSIGDDSCLYPRVVVYPRCSLGRRAIVHSGAVIGADGFGLAQDEAGRWVKIPQIGAVRIGDDVEIGANTTIDRGAIDDTVIEEGVKLDNQIQIGHNVRVGAHTAMAGFAGVAGSADIGRHCTIGAASVILGHLSIADHVHVSAATVISRSIRKPGTYTGMFPFDDHESWTRNTALIRRLADLAERLRALERKEKKNG